MKVQQFLTVSGIKKQIGNVVVLTEINFQQLEFKKIAVAGETGSGKSTLLKIIAGLVKPEAGDVLFRQHRVQGPDERLVPGEPGITYLSQHFELPPSLRVNQVLSYATTLSPAKSARVFRVCRISHLLERRTDELSGGEKQRVALAQVLVRSPRLLLLDEPYSNLDRIHKDILKSVVEDITSRLKITCMLVSHDPADLLPWADEILILKKGKIIQRGAPVTTYDNPVTEYAAGLFGPYNIVDPVLAGKAGLPPISKGRKHLVRPHAIRLSKKGVKTIAGTVTRISFSGDYYELQVTTPTAELVLHVPALTVKVGSSVNLRFSLS